MSDLAQPTNHKSIKIILFILLLLLTGLGIWNCPNLSSDKESVVKVTQKKEDSLELKTPVPSEVVIEKNTPTKNEIKISPKEEIIPTTPINTQQKNTPEIEKEEKVSETVIEKTPIVPKETSFHEERIVYNVDKKIDGRLPASFDNTCHANTIFKISKSTIQTSVDISPNGTQCAVGNHNNYVSVLNMEGKELLKLIGHKGYVQSIKYAPNGKFIVSGSMDQTAKLWDANTGKEIRSLNGHTEGILCVAYSSNGKYIATGSLDHTTIIWDAKSGKKRFQLVGHKSEIAEVSFSTNSKLLITGSSDGTAKIWDVETGKISYSLEGHDGVVGGTAFTPNDNLIITSSVDKIRLWDAKTGKHIHTINDNKARIMSIFISNDGAYISSSTVNGLIKIWKIKGGKKVCEYAGHSKRAREAVFHPTQKNTVISVSNDHTISMWNFEPE